MRKLIRSPTLGVALLALFLAAGGTSFAVGSRHRPSSSRSAYFTSAATGELPPVAAQRRVVLHVPAGRYIATADCVGTNYYTGDPAKFKTATPQFNDAKTYVQSSENHLGYATEASVPDRGSTAFAGPYNVDPVGNASMSVVGSFILHRHGNITEICGTDSGGQVSNLHLAAIRVSGAS